MLFFVTGEGTMVRADSTRIFQGSNNVTEIQVVMPFSGVGVSVAFTLPNGVQTDYFPMQNMGHYVVQTDESGTTQTTNLYYYTLLLTNSVTEYVGQVGVSVNVTSLYSTGQSSSTTNNLTSYTADFTVEYSALPTVAGEPTASEWQQIIDLLNTYYGTLSSQVNQAQTDITALQSDMTEAQGNISTLQTEMAAAQEDIDNLQTDVAEIQVDLVGKQDVTDPTLNTPTKTVVGAINEIYAELTDTSGTGFASRLDTAEAEINVLDSRMDDVEALTAQPLMTDLSVDIATSTATKYYNNGTQSEITLPTGDTAERINFLTSVSFTESQWTEQSDGTYSINFTSAQTGRTNNSYVANLEATSGTAQVITADQLQKNADGSITLQGFTEPFDGRIITVAAGQHGSIFHFGTAVTGTGTQTSSDTSLAAAAMIGDAYINTATSEYYECAAVTSTTSTWEYLGNLQGQQGEQGEGFSIYKTYASVAAMNADAANVPDGAFVMIASDTSDPDNASLYVRTTDGENAFDFIADLSGASIKGEDGATFTPSVDTNGNLSWTNNGGLENPATVNIKGAQGEAATVQVGTTTTLAAGAQATVNNSGTSNAAVVNFGIPKGATFTPSVDSVGNLSWSNDGGLSNPATVNIKGEPGADGTVVEGNPTEAGTEDLTKIKIGDAVYTVPSGGGGSAALVDLGTVTIADNTGTVSITSEQMTSFLSDSPPTVKMTIDTAVVSLSRFAIVGGTTAFFAGVMVLGGTTYAVTLQATGTSGTVTTAQSTGGGGGLQSTTISVASLSTLSTLISNLAAVSSPLFAQISGFNYAASTVIFPTAYVEGTNPASGGGSESIGFSITGIGFNTNEISIEGYALPDNKTPNKATIIVLPSSNAAQMYVSGIEGYYSVDFTSTIFASSFNVTVYHQ